MENPELEILFLIDTALANDKPDWLAEVTCDTDADSGEIIFELVDGRSFVLSTSSIRPLG